jgi:hypothetical protein
MRRLLDVPKLLPLHAAVICGAVFGCVAGTPATTDNGAGGSNGSGGGNVAGTGGANGAAGSNAGTGGATAAGSGGSTVPRDAGNGTAGSSGSGGAGTGGRTGTGGTTGAGGATTGAGGAMTGAGGAPAGLPAFPGADGAGSRIKGGRGGTVYHVTLLDTDYSDVRPGTLRYGLTQLTGPRTIVFDVSGVISLGRTAVAGWDSNGNGWDTASRLDIPSDVTIAGQTAPGPIIIMGGTVKPGGTNIILRNITFAPGYGNRSFNEPTRVPAAGDFPDSYTYDALDISGQNLIIDHVTAVYGSDETVSMNELANNITVQWSTIAQGQNYPQADAEASALTYTGHSLGSLFQAGSNAKVSILHNLYAHLKGRLPRVGTETTALTTPTVGAFNDFRNNVFYNWLGTAGTGAAAQPSQNNFINNFYLAGNGGDNPVGGTSTAITTSAGGTSIFNGDDTTVTKVFQSGNLKDTNRDGDAADGVALTSSDFTGSAIQTAAFTQTPYFGVTATATTAYSQVLDFAGAAWWSRAPIDQRIINETRTGAGKIMAWADDPFNTSATEGTEWRAMRATTVTTRAASFDTDKDGMPDAWEMMHGLNPAVADNNGDFDGDGYTNLEEYINEIAAWPAMASVLFRGGAGTRYAEITNWTLDPRADAGPPSRATRRDLATACWQPSRFDVVEIHGGRAIVDAVGQHAGTLRIAGESTKSAAPAALAVTHGWLDVADRVEIGARAQVDLTGGRLTARGAVVLGAPVQRRGGKSERAGVLRLAGGTLETPALIKAGAGGDVDGAFAFTGGVLQAARVGFDLVDRGGAIAPGPGIARTDVLADLAIVRGALVIDVAGPLADQVTVAGTAHLGGVLEVHAAAGFAPRPGDHWTILTAGRGVSGSFTSVTPGYAVSVAGNRVILTATAPAAPAITSDRARCASRSGPAG